MKYFSLIALLLALNCSKSKNDSEKKENKTENTVEIIKEKKEIIIEKKVKEQSLLLVVKNHKQLRKVESFIKKNQLKIDSLEVNKETLKVVNVKVPIDKKENWIEKLNATNLFSKIEDYSENNLKHIIEFAENTFLRIRKTKCSGDCSVFEATILKNGLIIFNGIDNVPNIGLKDFKLTEEQFKMLKEKFSKTNFGTYFDAVLNESNKDFSSIFILHKNKEIEVKLWKNAPEELAIAYDYLDSILLEKKLIY